MTIRHTDEQVAFLDATLYSSDHLLLRSTAGSGKTSTLTEAARLLPFPERAMYFVYNKHATTDVQGRLPAGMKARTVHAHGFSLLSRAARAQGQKLTVDANKSADLLAQLRFPWLDEPVRERLRLAWDTWREERLGEGPEDAERLAGMIQWAELQPASLSSRDWTGALEEAVRALRGLSLADWETRWRCDYTDMLWLSLELGLGRRHLQVALVDEAQDFTALRTAFVAHLLGLRGGHGRLIAAGDPEQEVFAYSMHQRGTLWQLGRDLGAKELTLSVSFRCPREVTRLAGLVSNFIRPAPDALPGQVLHVPAQPQHVPAGSTVLARHNGTLLEFAASVTRSGRPATLNDPALGKLLSGAIRQHLPHGLPCGDIGERLEASLLGPQLAGALQAVASLQGSAVDQPRLLDTVVRLTAPHPESNLYFTVHKAKGREWRDVTLLLPEDFSLNTPQEDPEACVTFVALTRSKHTLRLAYGPVAWSRGELLGTENLSAEEKVQLMQNPAGSVTGGRSKVSSPPPPVPPRPASRELRLPPPGPWPDIVGTPGGLPLPVRVLRQELASWQRSSKRHGAARYLQRQLDLLARERECDWVPCNEDQYHATRRYVRVGGLGIPSGLPTPGSVRVVMINEDATLAHVFYLQPNHRDEAHVTVTLPGGQNMTFSLEDGEVAGQPFAFPHPFLHAQEVQPAPGE